MWLQKIGSSSDEKAGSSWIELFFRPREDLNWDEMRNDIQHESLSFSLSISLYLSLSLSLSVYLVDESQPTAELS